MTKEEMIAILQAQQPSVPEMGSAPGAFPFSLPSLPGATAPVFSAPQVAPQQGQMANPYFASPQVASQVAPPAAPTLSEEQMRHQLAQMTPLAQTPFAPMAPPLQGPVAPVAPPLEGPLVDPAAVPMNARSLATDEISRGQALDKLSTTKLFNSADSRVEGQKLEAEAGAMQIGIDQKRKQEQNAIDDAAAHKAARLEEQMQAITERGEAAATAQMARVQSAADAASQMSVHNFWEGKDTGARILGVLAQAFAGAANGLAGNPSAPTPLDRIIQRDMELQMANMQQANRNVENQRGILQDIYSQVGSQQAAMSALYQAAWKRVELQGKQLQTKFATPEADAAMKQLQGIAQQRIADNSDKTFSQLRTSSIQQQQHGINALGEAERTDAMTGQAAAAGSQKQQFHLAGTKGNVDAQTYGMFKDTHESYTTVMTELSAINQVAREYQSGKISEAEAITRYNTARGLLLTSQRKLQGTGAALSEQEMKNLETQLPQLGKSFFGMLGKGMSLDMPTQVQQIMDATSRHYFSNIGSAIQGVQLDPHDPLYGRQVQRYMNEVAAAQQGAQ